MNGIYCRFPKDGDNERSNQGCVKEAVPHPYSHSIRSSVFTANR